MRKLVNYIAASIDGFIAGPEGETDFFATSPELLEHLFGMYPETCPTHVRGPLGVAEDPRRFDTVVMGARTHEPALAAGLTSAYPHLRQYVVTHRVLPEDDSVTLIDHDPSSAVAALKREQGGDIWLCGGADLATQLIDQIDELQIKRYPVIAGSGTALFRSPFAPRAFDLRSIERLPGGVLLETFAP